MSEAPGVNELGRLGEKGSVVLQQAAVAPNSKLGAEEIGYDYAVSFTLDGKQEDKGTVLFKSKNATFYLADPKEGKLGFEREGYLNTFNYRVEPGKTVTLTIEGSNRMTRLLVDGKVKEQLDPKPLLCGSRSGSCSLSVEGASPYEPIVYQPTEKINYQRTLVFPLAQAGQFKERCEEFESYGSVILFEGKCLKRFVHCNQNEPQVNKELAGCHSWAG